MSLQVDDFLTLLQRVKFCEEIYKKYIYYLVYRMKNEKIYLNKKKKNNDIKHNLK